MKAILLLTLAVLAVSASRVHEMPKSLELMANLPRLLKKNTKGDPITDCTKCYNDVLGAIESCGNLGDDTNAILVCVESIIGTSADCVTCICDVLGILGGADTAACDPASVKEFIKTHSATIRKELLKHKQ